MIRMDKSTGWKSVMHIFLLQEIELKVTEKSSRTTENAYAKMEMDSSICCIVALLFYVHGKHLRSCRDGQLT